MSEDPVCGSRKARHYQAVFSGVACGESSSLEVYDGCYGCHMFVLGTVSTSGV
jgi:hypothetical protein